MHTNELGQPIGYPVVDYLSPPLPNFAKLEGTASFIEPISPLHLPSLFSAFSQDSTGANWTYLPYGPFAKEEEFLHWAMKSCFSDDPQILYDHK